MVWDVEVVEEGVAGGDGALSDECRAVRPGGRMLEHAVPVLQEVRRVALSI